MGEQFCGVGIEKIKRKLRGKGAKKNEKYKYHFRFYSIWGLAHLNNLLNLKTDFFLDAYYEISGKARLLFRAISWDIKLSYLTISQVSRILRLKEIDKLKSRFGVRNRKQIILKVLEELKRTKLIKDFKEKGHGKNIFYAIYKHQK